MRPRNAKSFSDEARFLALAILAGVRISDDYEWRSQSHEISGVCRRGHDVNCRPGNILSGSGWCRKCMGMDSSIRSRSKASAVVRFEQAAASAGVRLTGPYVNAHTGVAGVCPQGHLISPAPHNIQRGHGWCIHCRGDQSIFYVVVNHSTNLLKLGIATTGEREARHAQEGYTSHVRWVGLPSGRPREVEKLIIRRLRDDGNKPRLRREYFDISLVGTVTAYAEDLLGLAS